MKQEVNQVIAKWCVAPELMFQPEYRVNERIVLLRAPWLSPDLGKSIPGPQFGPGDMSVVIPDWGSVQRGEIRD